MSVPLSSSFIHPEDISTSGVDSRGNSINSANGEMYGSQEDEASGVTAMHSGYSPVGDGHEPPAVDEQAQPHFYDSWTGYCFTVNYILGVGVLGMPYAFYKGGYLLSTLCLALVTIMATFTALWLVDVSLRAQYIKRENRLLRGSVTMSNEPDQTIMYSAPHTAPVSTQLHHRYEMNELTQMFLGLKARRFYELLVIIYLVGALWSYSSVFSSLARQPHRLAGHQRRERVRHLQGFWIAVHRFVFDVYGHVCGRRGAVDMSGSHGRFENSCSA